MTHLTPDDLRPLLERALPLIGHPWLVERVAEFMVTGIARMVLYGKGEAPWKSYNRIDYFVHETMRAIADKKLHLNHYLALSHALDTATPNE